MCRALAYALDMAMSRRRPRCVPIAGPNGAAKTTFAYFVNADLIASGLSPLKPELATTAAAGTVLREIDRLAAERVDFAFETTCSGLTYVRRPRAWKQAGAVPRMCRTQIGCAVIVPWSALGRVWQALQVVD
jgi:predicted ABC-type ATPase